MTDSRFPDSIQKPTFPQYTNLALNDGLADQLMALVNHHIQVMYDKGLITGSDFANVYVGSIGSVLQFTTQYLLGVMLIDEQKAKLLADIELVDVQRSKVEVEKEMLELQKAELRYRIEELLPLQKQQLELQNLKIQQDGLLVAAQITLTNSQVDKIAKEIEFLTAKILTEQANTQSGIAAADSLIGRQMSLLAAQKLGFAGDLQVKSAKVYADYDAVVETVNENGVADLSTAATTLLDSATTTAAAIGGL